ncbi:MAG TPA: protein kinase [Gammaproteobacteria bacterium]|nr:protein kinase [Gammaproteobacteria bacterium]
MTETAKQRGFERIGRYVITRELGRGSTSIVYLAHDVERGSDVAVKLYHPDHVRPERAHTRRKLFVNEARLAGELNHPNLVSVLDAGTSGEDAYIVTEYLRGATPLSAYTRLIDLLPQQQVTEILFACAKALDYAHRRGVIHRDIKPSNILLMPDGMPKIIDFGVAVHSLTGTQTVTGLIGSPSYMAPEQVKNGTATALSDIYSLGVVGYELLTSKRPFYGENLSHLVHQIIYATPPPLLKLRASVPRALADLVERAMEKDPEKRFPNALAMAAVLARVVSEFEQDAGRLELQDRFDIVRHLPFFRDFSYAAVWEAVSHSGWHNYEEDEEVLAAGTHARAFYVVVSGELALERDGRQIDVLRRGETLGALSLLAGRAVRSRAVALSPLLVMRIDAAQLEAMSAECQLAFHKVFNKDLLRQLAAACRERDSN